MKVHVPLLLAPVAAVLAADSCKVISGDASWPAKSEWRKAMPEIETQKSKANWKQPNYRLDASTVAEVIAAVNFTREHNIRLSILASGHDFVGRNDAPTGLTLSVSGLKGARVLSSFTASKEGVPAVDIKTKPNVLPAQSGQAYVTFGAGYNTRELNNLLAPSGLFTLGAAHGSVSVAGGWGQTAGHAPFSAKYGLGVDQVVEYKVVTADGLLRVASEISNPNLFWALRGGGGGTYGVVVEATIKAHRSQKVSTLNFWVNTTKYDDYDSIYPAAANFQAQFTRWNDKGLGAYYWLYPNAMSIFVVYTGEDASNQWIVSNVLPVLQNMSTFPGIAKTTMVSVPTAYRDFWSFFKAIWGDMPGDAPPAIPQTPGAQGQGTTMGPSSPFLQKRHGPGEGMMVVPRGIVYLDSWLLGKTELHSPNFAAVLKATMPTLPGASLGGQFIGGGRVIELGKNESTSVLPAWRKTYLQLIIYAYGKPSSLPLRKFAPEMGAYANEAYPITHQKWQSTYWGSNYARLSALKKEYDPTGLFWVTPGIDADAWTAAPDGRLCRSGSKSYVTSEYSPLNDNKNEADVRIIDEIAGPPFLFVRKANGSIGLNLGKYMPSGPKF